MTRTTSDDVARPQERPPMGRSILGRLAPLLAAAILVLVAFLLHRTLSRYSLDQVVASVSAIPLFRLVTAGGFAAASYFCLTGFDALAVRYAGHSLPYRRIALASFVSLSIGHNIGLAALSSGTIRYRFYTRWGLRPGQVAKVILFCGLTVGLGLMVLAGLALLFRSALAQEIMGLQRWAIVGVGGACLALPIVYVVLAAIVRTPIRWRDWSLQMPDLPLALGQVVVGPLNFALVAACLHQTLAAVSEVPYPGVAAVYVIANVSAIVTHVPGGLGVLESVVLFLLPQADLIGALVVFRLVYFLVPLCLGGLVFLGIELSRYRQWRSKRRDRGVP